MSPDSSVPDNDRESIAARDTTKRPWSAWIGRGSLAMAALAVLSLGATVFVAQRALSGASDVIVRGEADALMSTVVADLADDAIPPTEAELRRELETNGAAGLRYVALIDREGRPVLQAGTPALPDVVLHPGQSTVAGERVRAVAMLFPPRRGHDRQAGPPPRERPPGMPPLVVIELEPPIIQKLRRDLMRISVVAAGAGTVLLAFAFAWSRSASRLALVERRAAREQRLVALGSMSSVMAHELRNPLASLKGHAQLLAEDLEVPKQKAKAERVVAEAERLELLTTSLLDFVRDGPIERASLTPAELIERALEDLAEDRVDVSLDGAPKSLVADGGRLSRAVHNLVDNALQATTDGQHVDLVVTSDGSGVVIEVRDRGPGIPAGTEAQIFEPFVTTRVRGTGLGLAVARRIAEQHGGTLTGQNHPTSGAVFRLRFPREMAT